MELFTEGFKFTIVFTEALSRENRNNLDANKAQHETFF